MIIYNFHHLKIVKKNSARSQIYIHIPREDSFLSLLNSYLDLIIDVLHAVTNSIYADGNDIRLVNPGPIVLSSNYRLTTSSGKQLEDISHAHIVSLMYKLITSSRGADDLSLSLDLDRERRQRELTNNKTQKGKYHVRIMLKGVFGFAEHQEKATIGLGSKLTLTRISDNAVLNKGNAINNAKIKNNAPKRHVPH